MRTTSAFLLASLFASAPALAADPQQTLLESSGLHSGGTVTSDISYLMFDPDNVDIDMAQRFNAGLSASYAKPLSKNTSFELDGLLDGALQSDDDDDQTLYEGTLAGHLSWRDPSTHLLGLFGGGGFSVDNGDNGGPSTFYFVGLEGQLYLNRTTLQGQVGFLDGQDNWLETIDNAYFLRGVASHYTDDNTKFSAELSFIHGDRPNGDPTSGGVIDVLGWGARMEHIFAGRNFSMFLAYNGYDFRTTEESDAPWVNEIKIGLVHRFGSSTIFDNDRNAAGLDLPPASRWISVSTNEIE